jgi:hypothetical protein
MKDTQAREDIRKLKNELFKSKEEFTKFKQEMREELGLDKDEGSFVFLSSPFMNDFGINIDRRRKRVAKGAMCLTWKIK